MSDEIGEMDEQEQLAAIRNQLLKYVISAGIGWAALTLTYWKSSLFLPGAALFFLITPWFCWRTMFSNGLIGAFMGASYNYEVITTYSDGSKSSDRGSEAMQLNIILLIIKIPLFIFGAVFLKAWYILFGCYKYYTLYRKAETKPSLVKSAFPVMIAGVIMFFGFFGIGKTLETIYHAQINANFAKGPYVELNKEVYAPGETIIMKLNPGPEFPKRACVYIFDTEGNGPFNDFPYTKGNYKKGIQEHQLQAPTQSGSYEVRYYGDYDYNNLLATKKFKVK